jgi:cytochrome P450
MAGYEDMIRAQMAEYLDPLMGRDEFDLVGEFSAPFPVEIICALLGIDDREKRQHIRHLADITLHREEGEATGGAAAHEAMIEQAMLFYEFAAHKRSHPGDDICTALIEARVETEDGELASLTDEEIAGFCSLLGAAGSETVTKAVANAAVLFHRHPDQWQKVKDDPTRIPDAVEEVLRYWAPSQYQGRMSTTDMEWHGVTVPAGKPVFLLTGAANHDEREFTDPDAFDIDRDQRLAISLGHGVHTCLGAALARMETAVAIDEIRRRWPDFTVDEDRCERVQMSNVAGYSTVPVRTN